MKVPFTYYSLYSIQIVHLYHGSNFSFRSTHVLMATK